MRDSRRTCPGRSRKTQLRHSPPRGRWGAMNGMRQLADRQEACQAMTFYNRLSVVVLFDAEMTAGFEDLAAQIQQALADSPTVGILDRRHAAVKDFAPHDIRFDTQFPGCFRNGVEPLT